MEDLNGLQKDLIKDLKHKLTILGLVQIITKKDFCPMANEQMEKTFFVQNISAKDAEAFLQSAFDWCDVYTADLLRLKAQREYHESYIKLLNELREDEIVVGLVDHE